MDVVEVLKCPLSVTTKRTIDPNPPLQIDRPCQIVSL